MKEAQLKHAAYFYVYLLIVWGFYRLLIKFPEPFDELIVKPAIWLFPTYYLLWIEKADLESIGLSFKNAFLSLYFMIFLGIVFLLAGFGVNFLKYGTTFYLSNLGETEFLSAVILSFLTAFSEEVAFRGYIFDRVWNSLNSQWSATIITSIGWVLIHLPISIFDWRLTFYQLFIYCILLFLFSVGASIVYARTKNVFAVVFLHVLWQWPIILFR